MKTLTDAKEIEDKLIGKVITNICHTDESIEIYFDGGVISIQGEKIDYLGVNAQLEVEVRLS